MPFYFIVFPPWFQLKYPRLWENLKTNQNRLTTPFDVYATLKDILQFTGKVKKAAVTDRGISLFAEIPPERTCEHAAILNHWCTCQDRTLANVSDIVVVNAARKLVEVINTKVAGESQCEMLELDKITNALVSGLSEKLLTFQESVNDVLNRTVVYGNPINGVFNYLITILIKPGEGLFEGTVQYTQATGIYLVSDEISRINRYDKLHSITEGDSTRQLNMQFYAPCDRVTTQAHDNGPRHVPLVDWSDMTTSGQDKKLGKAGRGRADPGTAVVSEPATSADMHWPSFANSLVSPMKPGFPVLWAPL
uniref:Uncharacterized protein n=1 Tax=Strigamia maritima TaxID=126957 RepID=T1IKR3_STRMM